MANKLSSQIIFLTPAFIPKIWGSQKLAHKFNFDLPKNSLIGEAWLISGHCKGMSYVLNGFAKGLSLAQLFKDYPQLFGNPHEIHYPLLTKILDANDNLSVQIHPNDEYAQKHNQSLGKTECWYVLDCLPIPQGQVILGHYAKSKDQFKQWVDKDQWSKLLKYVPIKVGQFIYVPALKIHGLLAHTMVFELQQSSDITYRLYDYARRDNSGNYRTLHLKEAENIIVTPDKDSSKANSHDNYLVDNQFYKLIKINNQGTKDYSYLDVRWLQISVLDGKGTIDGQQIKKGDSFILPNGYNSFTLDGDLMMMVSYC